MTAIEGFPRNGHAYSAAEVGDALAGLIRRDSNGLPVPGMLGAGPTVSAVAASWKVEVSPFTFIARVGSGVEFTGLSAAEQVDIEPATAIPAGQGRIDVVAWDAEGDELVVIPGTPSASPVAPSASGFEPVATVRVNSGDGMVIAGQVTPVFERTGLAGGDRKTQGVVSKRTVAAGGSTTVPIVFPPGLFTEPPVVIPAVWGLIRDTNATVDNITKDGCTIILGSTSPVVRTIGAQWRAEQM